MSGISPEKAARGRKGDCTVLGTKHNAGSANTQPSDVCLGWLWWAQHSTLLPFLGLWLKCHLRPNTAFFV